MGRRAASVLEQARQSTKNIRFSDLCRLVEAMGYVFDRQKGSHMMYRRPGMPLIDVQDRNGKAKPYQVDQVLKIIDDYKMEVK